MAKSPIALLVIDDNVGSLELLSSALKQPGVEILTASDPEAGLELVRTRRPQIVITDLVMPRLDGMQVLERIIHLDPSTEVILMTAHYSTESAVEAIRKGAADYLNKPISIAALRERIGVLLENVQRRQRAMRLEDELSANSEFEGIVGNSPVMWDMFSRMLRIAPHYRSVLVTGETGTGKDLIAQVLHRLSPVSQNGRLVVLNCSAVVETLFESELFGHVKGAFTGAAHDKPGLFEHASGGTLFLDEIGDMPLSTQAKLLRVLQNQEVLRVGSLTPRKVDVRVIAATNHDLRGDIAEKRFRQDLYYRLSMVEIQVPRLADRKEDLPLLERHFIARFASQYGKEIRGLSRRAQIAMSQHSWPGNIREVENVIGHACMMTTDATLDIDDFPPYMQSQAGAEMPDQTSGGEDSISTLDEQERTLIVRALEQAGGNQSQAARSLRIGRDAMRYKLKKYNL